MDAAKLLAALTAATLLGACEARIGKEDEAKADTQTETVAASAEGKAEEGSFSIKVPGFDMKVDIPDSIAKEASVDSDSGILYPGSTLSGMHVEASSGKQGSGVELRFTSTDAPAKVAAWYRDPARAADFAVASAAREGDALVIRGTEKDDGDPFTLRLSPRDSGSEGRLTLRDRS